MYHVRTSEPQWEEEMSRKDSTPKEALLNRIGSVLGVGISRSGRAVKIWRDRTDDGAALWGLSLLPCFP